jgi:hypothetical protein
MASTAFPETLTEISLCTTQAKELQRKLRHGGELDGSSLTVLLARVGFEEGDGKRDRVQPREAQGQP